MGAVIKVHRPNLTPEERAWRIEQIKKATINFHREVMKNEQKKNAEMPKHH